MPEFTGYTDYPVDQMIVFLRDLFTFLRINDAELEEFRMKYLEDEDETDVRIVDAYTLNLDTVDKPTISVQRGNLSWMNATIAQRGDSPEYFRSKEVFKDPETGKPDKILTYIEQGAKYLPLIMKFAEGFMSSMKDFNARQPEQVQQQEPKMRPPEGWESFSPLEKMKYKYSRPDWYEAGLRWDAYKESGQINPQINTQYVDPAYQAPRRGQIVHDQQAQPSSLAELSRKHPEPPLIKDQGEQQAQPVHDPKLEAVIAEKQKRHMGKELNKKDNKQGDESMVTKEEHDDG